MAMCMVISEIYFQCSGFVQSIYVDNPVLSEGLFGGTENFLYISVLFPNRFVFFHTIFFCKSIVFEKIR